MQDGPKWFKRVFSSVFLPRDEFFTKKGFCITGHLTFSLQRGGFCQEGGAFLPTGSSAPAWKVDGTNHCSLSKLWNSGVFNDKMCVYKSSYMYIVKQAIN